MSKILNVIDKGVGLKQGSASIMLLPADAIRIGSSVALGIISFSPQLGAVSKLGAT